MFSVKNIVLLIIIIFVCSILVNDAVLIFGPLLFDIDYFSESKVINYFVIIFLISKIIASMYLLMYLNPSFNYLRMRLFGKIIIFPVIFLCIAFILLSYKQDSLGGLDSDFIEAMKVGSFKLTLSMVICFLYQDFYSKLKGWFESLKIIKSY